MSAPEWERPATTRPTYDLMASGARWAVFQLEGSGHARHALRKVRPEQIEDVIAIISLYVPVRWKTSRLYVRARKILRRAIRPPEPEARA